MTVYDIWLCDDEAVHLRGLEEKIARIPPDVRLPWPTTCATG